MVKKLFLDIHLYLGLIFAPYFIIYGLTTLAFQHGWGHSPTNTTTTHNLILPDGLEGQALGIAIRDSLGFFGSVPEWQIKKSDGGLSFRINRPGRNYHVKLDSETGAITLRKENFGLWGVIKWLHGMRSISGSAWSETWGIYSEVSIWSIVLAVLGGIYFWWDRAPERRIGWWVIGIGTFASALMMIYMAF